MTELHPVLAINTFVWHSPIDDDLLAKLAPRLAAWGYTGIEIPLENVYDCDAARTRELLQHNALTPYICAVTSAGRDLTAAPPDVVSRTQEYLRACVDFASAVGAARVIGPIYAAVGRTWRTSEDERKALVRDLKEALRPVVAHAGEQGVVLGLEPLNRYETSVVTTVEQALEVIDGLDDDAIGLAPDTYHMNIEEPDTPAALRTIGDRLVHLQVCGCDRAAPGYDHIDWPGIKSALLDVGYRGGLGIESFTPDNQTIATAASIWHPLAESPDALAQAGLAFLQDWTATWDA